MTPLKKTKFVCLDCETTGLDTDHDKIIEIAAITFTFEKEIDRFNTLVDPHCTIPEESMRIHHISQEMVSGKPKISEVLPDFLSFLNNDIIVGHGINFDLTIINNTAREYNLQPISNKHIDTLRLARHYGESASNSLEVLRRHFNIKELGAHRALNDVITTIEVFKQLCAKYNTLEEVSSILAKAIPMKRMPLGKYKGRSFSEVPQNYLQWASHQKFDRDLLFSIRRELKKRRGGNTFPQATNPFSEL